MWPIEISPLMGFGLMLIIGSVGGYLAHKVSWLPSITGFMIVGFLFGPSGVGLLDEDAIARSRILIDIALALILYRLGLSLDIKHLWKTPSLLGISIVESALTFATAACTLSLFGVSPVIATLVATIIISSSPAVLLHVAHEVGAEGEVTESTKTLVALNNIISFIAFSAALPAMHYAAGAEWSTIVLQPFTQLAGSLVLGAVIAFALHHLAIQTRHAVQYKLALVIGAIMVAIGLADQLKLSLFFVPLVIGVVVKSLERKALISDIEFGPAFELFFIIVFVFAGAGLHLAELIKFAPAVAALAIARFLAKTLGTMAMSSVFKTTLRTGVARGLLLTPMAGLAIGLTQNSADLFPQHASTIAAIVLGAVTIFETIGPPIAAFAFRFSGDAKNSNNSGTVNN